MAQDATGEDHARTSRELDEYRRIQRISGQLLNDCEATLSYHRTNEKTSSILSEAINPQQAIVPRIKLHGYPALDSVTVRRGHPATNTEGRISASQEDLNEWLEATGYNDLEYRTRALQRHRVLSNIAKQQSSVQLNSLLDSERHGYIQCQPRELAKPRVLQEEPRPVPVSTNRIYRDPPYSTHHAPLSRKRPNIPNHYRQHAEKLSRPDARALPPGYRHHASLSPDSKRQIPCEPRSHSSEISYASSRHRRPPSPLKGLDRGHQFGLDLRYHAYPRRRQSSGREVWNSGCRSSRR